MVSLRKRKRFSIGVFVALRYARNRLSEGLHVNIFTILTDSLLLQKA